MSSTSSPGRQIMRPDDRPVFATSNAEFARIIAYLELAVEKPIAAPDFAVARIALYHEALGDIPEAVLKAAAKKLVVCREKYQWKEFPSVAELCQAAVEIAAHGSAAPAFADAWRAAMDAAKRMSTVTDPAYQIIRAGKVMTPEQFNAEILSRLPPVVAATLHKFGPGAMREEDTCRAQFRGMYEGLVEKEQHQRLLPAALASQIEAIGNGHGQEELSAPVRSIIGKIGAA